LFALGVFLLPFAFPTEGAIVARFASTAEFSPNTPGGRATAGVAIQMRDPGRLTLTVMQGSQLVRTLIPTRSVRKGWITTAWDGTNQQGLAMPDGVYTLHLMASSGKKGYNVSRRATIDRTRPPCAGRPVRHHRDPEHVRTIQLRCRQRPARATDRRTPVR
jgi:hypothetical protein